MRRHLAAGKPRLPLHGPVMTLTVLHYHFRPGGVRRVIECGLPPLARAMDCSGVTLLSGEAPPSDWREMMERALHPCPVRWIAHPALGYWSEQKEPAPVAAEAICGVLREAIGKGTLWAHNLSVGRNLLLAREVTALPDSVPVWLHHHDWWWDGRWERWPEFSAQGFESLIHAVRVTLPAGDHVRHLCVNATDARRLSHWLNEEVAYVPNILAPPEPDPERIAIAREFLRHTTGAPHCWLYPCRALRRKNIAEALLVQRCLAPEAITVTTGGPSSAAEEHYFDRLAASARAQRWPLFPAVASTAGTPDVLSLTAAAEAVIVTSLKEGFGLPYGEAALAGRPCLARIPGGLEETLAPAGIPFARRWSALPVPRDGFDSRAERERLQCGRERLAPLLPPELLPLLSECSAESAGASSVDFGSLTLSAQLEVLTALKPGSSLPGLLSVEMSPLQAAPWTAGEWTTEKWLSLMAPRGKTRSPTTRRADWLEQRVAFITPQLQQWLSTPLLWPDEDAAATPPRAP